MSALVGVIMGSKSDWSTLSHTADMLEKLGIPFEVKVVSAHRTPDLLFQYAASGFRDFTRIAGSSPEMWRDITLANQDAMLVELDAYLAQLQRLRTMLAAADGAALEAVYANAQKARHDWISTIEAAEKQTRQGGD